jgi:competence protein ComEC
MIQQKVSSIIVNMEQNTPKYILFRYLAIAIIAGIAIASFVELDWQRSSLILAVMICELLSLAAFLAIFKIKYLPAIIILILLMAVGGVRYYSNQDKIINASKRIKNGDSLLEGVVVNNPEINSNRQTIIIKIEKQSGGSEEQSVGIDGKVLAISYIEPYPELRYGDRLLVEGCVNDPKVTPTFNMENYLKPKGVTKIIECFPKAEKVDEESGIKFKIFGSLYLISRNIDKSLQKSYSEPYASLASGLILGGSKKLPENIKEALKRTSLTHIVALSGYNVTIIITALTFLLSTRVGPRRSFYLGSALVVTFILMTGAASSVIRAGIFSLLIIYGRTIGRRGNQGNILLLAALSMLLLNPYALRYDLGFQLSFMAFLGLVYLSPILKIIAGKILKREIPEGLGILWDTLAAQTMVLPLILYNFGTISYIAPLANVAVLWIVPTAMGVSALTAVAGAVFLPAGQVFGYITQIALKYIILTVEKFSNFKYAATQVSVNNALIPLALYILIAVMIAYIKYKKAGIKKLIIGLADYITERYEKVDL